MPAKRVAIIDSGGANIASLIYACDRLGRDAVLTTDPAVIRHAERVILPGVGAAGDAMRRLREKNLVDVIRALEQPVLGICLGLQLLCEASEEEDVDCLGIIAGVVQKLAGDTHCPVPNMGWCQVKPVAEHDILEEAGNHPWFYFLHSYALPVSECTIAVAEHASCFSAMIAHKNFVATQFHPERSSSAGARLLQNFLGGGS